MELWYFLIFIADGFIVLQIIEAAIDREIGGWTAGVLTVLLIALNGFMLAHGRDPIGPTIALVIVAFAATHRLLRSMANERALMAIKMRDMQEYQRMISEDPSMPYPYQAIGDFFFDRQMWEEAIAYYERFLSLQPDPEVKWKLDHARDELRRQQKGMRLCPYCLNDIPKDASECPLCGHYLGAPIMRTLLAGLGSAHLMLLGVIAIGSIAWAVVRILHITPLLFLALVPVLVVAGVYLATSILLSRRQQGPPMPPPAREGKG